MVAVRWCSAVLCLLLVPACAAGNTEESTDRSESSFSETDGGGDPYGPIEHLQDEALKQALFDRIKGHRQLGYDGARRILMRATNADGKLECVYTGRLVTPDGTTTPGDFNTEHSWPQSLGADREPAKSDLHHLFAVDARANSARGNHPFGEVTCLDPGGPSCSYANGGSALGKTSAGATSFEVRKEKRGDIARAQFYFSIRYNMRISPAVETALRAWHHEDPVDASEHGRNDLIATNQRNRNPFIDRPEFVDQIADF